MGIVVFYVCAFDALVSSFMDGSIKFDVIVVADVIPTIMMDMVMTAWLEGIALVATAAGTVHDN